MDGESNNQPNFELPAQPGKVESAPAAAPERAPGKETPGSGGVPKQPVVTTDPSTLAQPAQDVPVGDQTTQPPATASPAHGDPADDTDLIEKQWVNKAKKIVEKTKNDPYVQNKELNKMKAEYVSKRFNKELKISEDKAA